MLQVLVDISQKVYCRKEAWAMQDLFIKKEKKSIGKNGQVSKLLKQWVLRCLPEKKRKMNKIVHVFLRLFPSSK
jgi:hypothetical protein